MNGRSLPAAHGFPARLIIPGLYGTCRPPSGSPRSGSPRSTRSRASGCRAGGPPRSDQAPSRIDVPRSGDTIDAGRQAIGGVAWAPHTGVRAVELSVDGGSWQRAELGRVASVDTWVQWRFEWDATAGFHEIRVRAIDTKGRVQTAETAPPAPDGATGHDAIGIEVSAA